MTQPNYSGAAGQREFISLRPVAEARGGDTTELPRVESNTRVQQQPAQRQALPSWGEIFRSALKKFATSFRNSERFRLVQRTGNTSIHTPRTQTAGDSHWLLKTIVAIQAMMIFVVIPVVLNGMMEQVGNSSFGYYGMHFGMPDIPGGVWHTIITVALTIGAILIINAVRNRTRSGSSDQH